MPGQPKTCNPRRNCPVSAQPQESVNRGVSRTKVAYWRDRIIKVKSRNGANSPNYSVRIVYQGRRVCFPLHLSNKEVAAAKAAAIYRFLVANGWEKTIARYKSGSANGSHSRNSNGATIGDLIRVAAKYTTVRERTFNSYVHALRKIVSDITGVSGRGKNDTIHGDGNKHWKQRINDIPLASVTPEKVQAWKQQRINGAGRDASSRRKASVTTNSQIRNAKALFSKKLLPFLGKELELPDPLAIPGCAGGKNRVTAVPQQDRCPTIAHRGRGRAQT